MKFAIGVVLIAIIYKGSAVPLVEEDGDVAKAAAAGDWDKVHELISKYVTGKIPEIQEGQTVPSSSSTSVFKEPLSSKEALTSSLWSGNGKPTPGGRYFSQKEYTYSRQSNNNGVVDKDEGGLGMIDDNGHITYYKPKNVPANIDPLAFAPQGWDYGNGQYGISPYSG